MAEIERYSPDDRRGLEQLYRRTYGHEAVDRLRFLWDWARRNPAADAAPPFWVVREGPTLIAACPVTPVRVLVLGTEVSGAWSAGPLVVAERQRQGLGGSLLRAWERGVGVAFGAGFSDATRQRLAELRWAKPLPLACLVKPISRRALRRPTWPVGVNRLVSALALPVVRVVAGLRPLHEEVQPTRRFDGGVDELWERVKGALALAVKRDARYLNWKFMEPPHVRYQAAVLRRGDEVAGYVIYRHSAGAARPGHADRRFPGAPRRTAARSRRWPGGSIARHGSKTPTRSAATPRTREFRRQLRRNGYFVVKSEVDVAVKVNGVDVPRDFYQSGDGWHLTLGDGAMDH